MYWFINIIVPVNGDTQALRSAAAVQLARPTASPGAVAGTGKLPWPHPAVQKTIQNFPVGRTPEPVNLSKSHATEKNL